MGFDRYFRVVKLFDISLYVLLNGVSFYRSEKNFRIIDFFYFLGYFFVENYWELNGC